MKTACSPRTVDRGGYHPGGGGQERVVSPSPHNPNPRHEGTEQESLPFVNPGEVFVGN